MTQHALRITLRGLQNEKLLWPQNPENIYLEDNNRNYTLFSLFNASKHVQILIVKEENLGLTNLEERSPESNQLRDIT